MSAFHMLFAEPDVEPVEGRYGFCWNCEHNVHAVRADHGIGGFEYWGSKGIHHDWRDVCSQCGEDLQDAKDGADELVVRRVRLFDEV
jgi:hypothetical protein